MKRSLLGVVCITLLLTGAFACGSDEKESAAETVETVDAANLEQQRNPATPSAAAANTLAAARAIVRSANQPKLNINTATEVQLATLPDVGKKMIHEFEEYRPYVSIRQFRREMGKYVDDAQVTSYERFLYVPITVNESDTETLEQIPGVTAKIAETLEEGRPYSTDAAFLMELAKHVTDPEARAAAAYLKRR